MKTPNIEPRSALAFGVICLSACLLLLSMSSWLDIPIWAIPLAFSLVMLTHDVLAYHVFQKRKNVPSLSTALRRMTWKIVPFVIGLFIMVEGLNSCGWVDAFASGLSMVSGSLLPSVFLMGFPSDMTLKVSYSPTGEADSIPLGSYKDLP